MKFNAFKIILKIHTKKLRKIQPQYSHKGIYLSPSTYLQDMREIPAIVNEEIVINCLNFHTFGGGTSLVKALANRQTDRFACLEQFFILDS